MQFVLIALEMFPLPLELEGGSVSLPLAANPFFSLPRIRIVLLAAARLLINPRLTVHCKEFIGEMRY